MGILDSKERLIDFILTQEGKKQAGIGQMKIEYATLTDYHTFYESDVVNGEIIASDPSFRIFFEACNKYQDVIVPELVGGTVMNPIRTSEYFLDGKNVFTGSFRSNQDLKYEFLTGSSILDSSQDLLRDISNNFINQKILSSEDQFSDSSGFLIYPRETAQFQIQPNQKFHKSQWDGIANLETSHSIFSDKRFSHLPNFDYLPPVNMNLNDTAQVEILAEYPRLNETQNYTFDQIKNDLIDKDFVTVTFGETSRDNNLLGQWFESSKTGFEKLSIIDFGEFDDDNDVTTPPKRVFFVGKIIKDKLGVETYLNIFTIIAEQG